MRMKYSFYSNTFKFVFAASVCLCFGQSAAAAGTPQLCSKVLLEAARTPDDEARDLVSQLRRQQDQRSLKTDGPLVDFRDSDIMVVFGSGAIESISKNGFLNAHQTKESSWAGSDDFDPDKTSIKSYLRARKPVEKAMAGKNITDEALLPKYGVVQFRNPELLKFLEKEGLMSGDTESGNGLDIYGEVGAILKDDVKSRTTFTFYDSLSYMGKMNAAERREAVKTSVFTFTDQTTKIDFNQIGFSGRYIEAQIWGTLSLSDVKYFVVNNPKTPWNTQEYADKIIAVTVARLRPYNIPIFLAKPADTKLSDAFPSLQDSEEHLAHLGYWIPDKPLGK
ncbi:MAG: hypothetical protein KF865_10970 [Bdellovibrionaceae bacterium]|nr:hypothetical protein [Pseudobdellovibrionaceae bacterium]